MMIIARPFFFLNNVLSHRILVQSKSVSLYRHKSMKVSLTQPSDAVSQLTEEKPTLTHPSNIANDTLLPITYPPFLFR